jgi:hypothetical protein
VPATQIALAGLEQGGVAPGIRIEGTPGIEGVERRRDHALHHVPAPDRMASGLGKALGRCTLRDGGLFSLDERRRQHCRRHQASARLDRRRMAAGAIEPAKEAVRLFTPLRLQWCRALRVVGKFDG